jgi:hypothetical protein
MVVSDLRSGRLLKTGSGEEHLQGGLAELNLRLPT